MKDKILKAAEEVAKHLDEMKRIEDHIHILTTERGKLRTNLDVAKSELCRLVENDQTLTGKTTAVRLTDGRILTVNKDQGVRSVDEIIYA